MIMILFHTVCVCVQDDCGYIFLFLFQRSFGGNFGGMLSRFAFA